MTAHHAIPELRHDAEELPDPMPAGLPVPKPALDVHAPGAGVYFVGEQG